jgi:hypothetical protein
VKALRFVMAHARSSHISFGDSSQSVQVGVTHGPIHMTTGETISCHATGPQLTSQSGSAISDARRTLVERPVPTRAQK